MEVVQVVVVFKCLELCFSWSLEDVSSFSPNSPAGVPGLPDLTGELLAGAALQVFLGVQRPCCETSPVAYDSALRKAVSKFSFIHMDAGFKNIAKPLMNNN